MAIPSNQQSHRDALGKAFTVWMNLCDFSQQTIHNMALCLGTEGPWNSQISLFQRAKLDMKTQFWVSLGTLNQAIESGDKSLFGPKHLYSKDGQPLIKNPESASRAIIDKLENAMPFYTADDQVAKASDFFAMFVGEQELNEAYTSQKVYSATEATEINEMCRKGFRKIAEDQMMNGREAWEKLRPLCTGMGPKQLDKFRSVLSGWEDWTVDEVNELTPPGGALGLPAQALDRLGKGLMSPSKEALESLMESSLKE